MSEQPPDETFDELGELYDVRCLDCGYRDEDGEWEAAAGEERVRYRYTCPRCGATRSRVVGSKWAASLPDS